VTRDHGFTLPEVLVASLVGFIVLAATLGLLESTLRLSGGVMSKTDAMQRGRLAVDRITQQLRSQVCRDFNTPAVVAGDTHSITFYADFSDGTKPPDKRVLAMNASTGNVTESVYKGSGPMGGPYSFPATPTRVNMVLENAALQSGVPFLRYYAYPATGTSRKPDAALPASLGAAHLARVARIDVALISRPTGARDNKNGIDLNDQVIVRHADPNLSVPDPSCA
jgi:prepilin-type N-terminal cleavage/methylation domain-containing protein